MVHGILQFTPSIAFRYVLHRCESLDIRCRESFNFYVRKPSPRPALRERDRAGIRFPRLSFPWRIPRRDSFLRGSRPDCRGRDGGGRERRPPRRPRVCERVRGSFCFAGFDNDPSAGSPTETLLRLLLPLNDKVQWTSRDVVGSEPPRSPRSEHFTGSFNR